MQEARSSTRRQFSVVLDEDDFAELEVIARGKRSSVAQVIREFVVNGIERYQRSLERAEATAGATS